MFNSEVSWISKWIIKPPFKVTLKQFYIKRIIIRLGQYLYRLSHMLYWSSVLLKTTQSNKLLWIIVNNHYILNSQPHIVASITTHQMALTTKFGAKDYTLYQILIKYLRRCWHQNGQRYMSVLPPNDSLNADWVTI